MRRIDSARNSLILNKNSSALLLNFLFGILSIFRISKVAYDRAVVLFEPVHLLSVEDRYSGRFAYPCVPPEDDRMLR